ncbi:MAG: helix-turn-helix transcriptional regulator [Armatimonadetes bacterium]|nr:helix-turn-helix transcriptional regulator [Armatimonadota bacterium]
MASTGRLESIGKSEVFAALEAKYANDPEAINYGLLMDATDLICREMEAQGLTRRELAERLGVSPQYVTKFLNTPSNTSLLQIVRFAQALGLDVISPIVARPAAKKASRPVRKAGRPARRAAAASP